MDSHYLFLTEDTVCKSGSYTWRDSVYHFTVEDTVLMFYERFSTVHGLCDSIYQLNLYIAPEHTYNDTLSLCDNDTLEWQNMLFVGARFLDTYNSTLYDSVKVDSAGVYDYVVPYTTMLGCDMFEFAVHADALAVFPDIISVTALAVHLQD